MRDGTEGIWVLTAGHVLGALSAGPPPIGSPVDHYGDGHGPLRAYRGALGSIAKRVPDHLPSNRRLTHDLGVVQVAVYGQFDNVVAGYAVIGVRKFSFNDSEQPAIDVWIEGAASGPRVGRLDTRAVAVAVDLADLATSLEVVYRRACWIESVDESDVACNGDSGAVCVDEDGRAVAMIVARENPGDEDAAPARALALPFWLIAQELSISDEQIAGSVVLRPTSA
jgi:hypothetical protein